LANLLVLGARVFDSTSDAELCNGMSIACLQFRERFSGSSEQSTTVQLAFIVQRNEKYVDMGSRFIEMKDGGKDTVAVFFL